MTGGVVAMDAHTLDLIIFYGLSVAIVAGAALAIRRHDRGNHHHPRHGGRA